MHVRVVVNIDQLDYVPVGQRVTAKLEGEVARCVIQALTIAEFIAVAH